METLHGVQIFCDVISDPRSEDWLLMSSPIPQTIIIVFYIYFVMSLGPRLMESRKPFDLKRVLVIYNFSVVAYSLYMCYEVNLFLFASRQTSCCFLGSLQRHFFMNVFCYIPLSFAFKFNAGQSHIR